MSDWVNVKDKLPENCKNLRFHKEPHFEFTTVFAADVKSGSVGVRNRIRRLYCEIEYLDKEIETTDWYWSRDAWQPTHWMPIPELPKEDGGKKHICADLDSKDIPREKTECILDAIDEILLMEELIK